MKGFADKSVICRRCNGKGFATAEGRRSFDEEQKKLWSCHDCSAYPSDDYMVKLATWDEAKGAHGTSRVRGNNEGILCLSCLEKRLGRELTQDDFDFSIPINRVIMFAFFMGKRAARKDEHELGRPL
jgi:hypothetical protein